MKKTFIAGAAAGASSLAVAVPLLAQVAGAASGTTTDDSGNALKTRPIPSQACVQALAARDATELSEVDAHVAAHKAALQAHQSALSAAASITDDAARQQAVQKANEEFRAAMEAAMGSPEDRQAEMEALKTACGDAFRFGGPGMMGGGMGMMDGPGGRHGGPGGGFMKGALAEKLGMTQEELKAALDSGKTIEDIAKEKGVELPARPEGMPRGGMMRFGEDDASSDSAEQQ